MLNKKHYSLFICLCFGWLHCNVVNAANGEENSTIVPSSLSPTPDPVQTPKPSAVPDNGGLDTAIQSTLPDNSVNMANSTGDSDIHLDNSKDNGTDIDSVETSTMTSMSTTSSTLSSIILLPSSTSPTVSESSKSQNNSSQPSVSPEDPDNKLNPSESITEKDDFDKAHPVNLLFDNVTFNTFDISWNISDQDFDSLLHYELYYGSTSERCPSVLYKSKTVEKKSKYFSIGGLNSGTRYSVCLRAIYSSDHKPNSHTISYTTLGCGPVGSDNPCNCDNYGIVGNLNDRSSIECNRDLCEDKIHCNDNACVCKCKQRRTGAKCDKCVGGYFLHKKMNKCSKCQCPSETSTGHCSVDENGVVVCECHDLYGGIKCETCRNGYYMGPNDTCVPCDCSGNHDLTGEVCNRKTGECVNCQHSTTGDKCDLCKDGYEGDAKNRTCIMKYTKAAKTGVSDKKLALIGLSAAAGILVVGIGIYFGHRRWKNRNQQPYNFWTVELDNERENVNFSQQMETCPGENDDIIVDDIFDPRRKNTTQSPTRFSNKKSYQAVNT